MKGPDEIRDLMVELEVLTRIGEKQRGSWSSFLVAALRSASDKVLSGVCGVMSYGLNQQVDSGCPSKPFSIQDGLKWHRRERMSLLKCLGHWV